MAKKIVNGKNLAPHYLNDSEVAERAQRLGRLLDQIDELPKKKKSLVEEAKYLRTEIREKCEMVEGEELPFTKAS
jgi:regulator of replication initiation timing